MYNVGMRVKKLKKMMQHTQKIQVQNQQPTAMWTMAKNYCMKLQNKVLPYFNRTGSGQTLRSGYDLVKESRWLLCAKKHNEGEEEKGRTGRYGLYFPKANYTDMKLWGVMDYVICNVRLNVVNSIVKVTGGGGENEHAGQKQHISRLKSCALKKAKIVPETFKAIDLANKAIVVKHGKRVVSSTFEVAKDDRESDKGIASSTLNNATKLNNDMKLQK
jgi:hypothetical protein